MKCHIYVPVGSRHHGGSDSGLDNGSAGISGWRTGTNLGAGDSGSDVDFNFGPQVSAVKTQHRQRCVVGAVGMWRVLAWGELERHCGFQKGAG